MWEDIEPYKIMINTEGLEPRAYQINIAKSIYNGANTLVILPTGLGKTMIALLAIAKVLYQNKSIIMLAPTKPLSKQHYSVLLSLANINNDGILMLTGSVNASTRQAIASNAKIIVATPQTIANDMKKNRITLNNCGLVIFDECHKAVGRYAYTYIANEAKLKGIQIIGLTASPGSNTKKINQLIETLGIEQIEMRVSNDIDVRDYVMDKSVSNVYVDKNEPIMKLTQTLKPLIDQHMEKLYTTGISPFRHFEKMPKRMLFEISDKISKIHSDSYKFMAALHYVYLINLIHAYDLVSTEGITPFIDYINSLRAKENKSNALIKLLADKQLLCAEEIANEALLRGEEHPKMAMCVHIIKERFPKMHILIFAQYRSTVTKLVAVLNSNGICAKPFMGKKMGITHANQQQALDEFSAGKFEVLVATSIGEEGLHIPSVDVVIFYEPVASEIRSIQRKGRAGRMKIGQVIIMVTRETKDEAYLMASNNKEAYMREIILKIKANIEKNKIGMKPKKNKGQRSLL